VIRDLSQFPLVLIRCRFVVNLKTEAPGRFSPPGAHSLLA
jgi:hypothetical protein